MDNKVFVTEKDGRLREFLSLCENSTFPHKDELLDGIATGQYAEFSYSKSEVPSTEILNIYRRRARHLAMLPQSVHAKRLLNDTEEFVGQLEKAINDKVACWSFPTDESSSFDAFVGVNSKRILGCLLAVDRRKVTVDEWEKLWGCDDNL